MTEIFERARLVASLRQQYVDLVRRHREGDQSAALELFFALQPAIQDPNLAASIARISLDQIKLLNQSIQALESEHLRRAKLFIFLDSLEQKADHGEKLTRKEKVFLRKARKRVRWLTKLDNRGSYSPPLFPNQK